MSSDSPAKYTRSSSEAHLSPTSRGDLSRTRSEMPSHRRRDSESRSNPSSQKRRHRKTKKTSISTQKSVRYNATLTLRRRRAIEEAKNRQARLDADKAGDRKTSKSLQRKITSLHLQQEKTKQRGSLNETTFKVNI